MTFIADPKNVHRVFAPESGFDLTRFFAMCRKMVRGFVSSLRAQPS